MSWSFGFTTNGRSFDKSATEALEAYKEQQAGYQSPVTSDQEEQIDAARAAAKLIIDSGAAGTADNTYAVTLGGHANPDHRPAPGWSNDTVSVSVYQSGQKS